MDLSAVKTIVEKHLEVMLTQCGVPHWRVVVRYEHIGDGGRGENWHVRGTSTIYPDYERALIRLDPYTFDDEEEVLTTLRHELFHVVLHPFTMFCDTLAPIMEKQDDPIVKTLDNLRSHVCEQLVRNLERMHYGIVHAGQKAPKSTLEANANVQPPAAPSP